MKQIKTLPSVLVRLGTIISMLLILTVLLQAEVKADTIHHFRPYQANNLTEYTGNLEKSFVMTGQKYIYGFTKNDYADSMSAIYNLDQEVRTVSFTIGHIDNARTDKGTFKVYLDGMIQESYTRTLTSDMMNESMTINTMGYRQLILVIEGYHATYGIANVVETGAHLYEGAVKTVPTTQKDGSYIYTCSECGDFYIQDIAAKRECDRLLLPYQSSGYTLRKEDFGSSTYVSVMGNRIYQSMAKNDYNDAANAYYNLNCQYENVSFKIGHLDNCRNGDNGTLKVYVDGIEVKNISLKPDMIEEMVTIDTPGATQLRLEISGYHAMYAIYDLKYREVSPVPKTHSFEDQIMVEAQFGMKGVLKHVCSNCGAYYTSDIPALKRSMKDGEVNVSLSNTTYTYNGKAKKPSVTVTYGYDKMKLNKDYTVAYSNNTKPGKATVKITGKGYYKNSTTITFTILPSKPSVTKLSNTKKSQLTVSWKKLTGVSGYEIQYATNSNLWYSTTVTASSSKSSITLKNLYKGSTYYVRVRGYKNIDGVRQYGEYSTTKYKYINK